jgi:hypothetical protein
MTDAPTAAAGFDRAARLARLSPRQRAVFAAAEGYFRACAPKTYRVHRDFCRKMGYPPFFAYPASSNEKLLWRKILDHDPRFVRLSDKLDARAWAREHGVTAPAPEVLWVGTDPADMPDALLTDDVVIKTNHAWRQLHFVRDGLGDRAALDAKLRGWLAYDHSTHLSQWAYRHVPRRLFLERVVGRPGQPLEDLKFHMFAGRPLRVTRLRRAPGVSEGQVYEPDADGALTLTGGKPTAVAGRADLPPLKRLDEMAEIARALASAFDYIRIDFLVDDDLFWLGEITVYPNAGLNAHNGADPGSPLSRDWDLRRSWFMRQAILPKPLDAYRRTLRAVLDAEDENAPRAGR